MQTRTKSCVSRFKKVDGKCNEWGYLDPKFGLICNYCHYSRVNIWNAVIVMMIMMAVRASEWAVVMLVTSSKHQQKPRKIWNEKNMRTKENIVLELSSKQQKMFSMQIFFLNVFTQIIFCFFKYFRLEAGENLDIWWKSDKMSPEEKRGDTVGLLGNSQQDPPQFQILHMI